MISTTPLVLDSRFVRETDMLVGWRCMIFHGLTPATADTNTLALYIVVQTNEIYH